MKKILVAILLASALSLSNQAYSQWETQRKVSLKCGDVLAVIECGKSTQKDSDRKCNSNTLSFNIAGKVTSVQDPKTKEPKSTPINLSCLKDADSKLYIAVDYVYGRTDCSKCKVTHLFDSSGSILTEYGSATKLFSQRKITPSKPISIE